MHDVRPGWTIPARSEAAILEALPAGWEGVSLHAPVTGEGDGGGGVRPEVLATVRGAEVYVGFGVPREVFLAATEPPEGRLRWAHTGAAGVGGALYPEMVASDVVLTNSAGIHAPPIAESVLAMMLHFARGLDVAVRRQAERRWDAAAWTGADAEASPREMAGATLGVYGFGGIGREVARRALALGMRVAAVKRHPSEPPPGIELWTGVGALGRLLDIADYLVLTVPSTAETHHAIDAAGLARMKPDAVLVNVSRGRVVDEAALARALAAGRLRGAALDVFEHEPLPADSPLWTLPNVLITPHVSGTTPRFWERETALIVDNLRRYLAGEPLRNVVDKRSGY